MTNESAIERRAERIERDWAADRRWEGIERDYTAHDVVRLQGSLVEDHTLARMMSEKLWRLLHDEDYINALGAISGGQAVQMAKAYGAAAVIGVDPVASRREAAVRLGADDVVVPDAVQWPAGTRLAG